jgi:hypothetical protein
MSPIQFGQRMTIRLAGYFRDIRGLAEVNVPENDSTGGPAGAKKGLDMGAGAGEAVGGREIAFRRGGCLSRTVSGDRCTRLAGGGERELDRDAARLDLRRRIGGTRARAVFLRRRAPIC